MKTNENFTKTKKKYRCFVMTMTTWVNFIATRSTNPASSPVMLAPVNQSKSNTHKTKGEKTMKLKSKWVKVKNFEEKMEGEVPISHLPEIETFNNRAFHEVWMGGERKAEMGVLLDCGLVLRIVCLDPEL